MNAEPLLAEVVRAFDAVRLETVLIGNAAAALQGAPVTTVDFDFMFRKTPRTQPRQDEGRGDRTRLDYPATVLSGVPCAQRSQVDERRWRP